MNDIRKKAFIGALIGTAASVIGSVISNKKQKKAAEQEYALQQAEAIKKSAYGQANAMQQLANNDISSEILNSKIKLKNGGKIDMDRIKQAKRYSCGGRKKAVAGAVMNFAQKEGGDIIQGVGNLATSILNKPIVREPIQEGMGFNFAPKTTITPNSYDNIATNTMNNAQQLNDIAYKNRLQQQRFGGKIKAKCK